MDSDFINPRKNESVISGRLPNFLVIGAMKSATTSLHDQLECQADFFMSSPKELHYFSDLDVFGRGPSWYLEHFAGATPHQLCGESSTSYTKLPTYPGTVKRIQELLPDIRFVYVIRHPVDRLLSQYVHEVTERRIPRSTSLRDALKLRSELIDYSRYAMQIEPYIEAYGPDRVLIAFSERFRHCPQFEFERICRFLGCRGVVKWRTDRSFHNRSRDRMMAGFMTHFIVNNEPFRRVRQGLVPKSIRDVVRSLLASNIEKPEVSEETAGYLRDIFDRDLRQLGKYFSCDLSYDTYADVADAACGEA